METGQFEAEILKDICATDAMMLQRYFMSHDLLWIFTNCLK